jgi:hypothetical protein
MGVWVRDLETEQIRATAKWRSLFGFSRSEHVELQPFLVNFSTGLSRDTVLLNCCVDINSPIDVPFS